MIEWLAKFMRWRHGYIDIELSKETYRALDGVGWIQHDSVWWARDILVLPPGMLERLLSEG